MAYLGRKGASAALTSADIPNDSITSAKIPDDALDSEHYTDGSIDSAHIGDDQVTGAKIENNPTIAGNLTVSGDLVPATPLSHRNIVINGAMKIAQRGTQEHPVDSTNYSACDRFQVHNRTAGTCDTYSDTESPDDKGFSNSLKVDITALSSGTTPSDNEAVIGTYFEGQDLQQIRKGTSEALPLTLSFWVRSPKTGIHIVELYDFDSSTQRFVSAPYTISTANTWQFVTHTFPADTASGKEFDNDNAKSLGIQWWLCAAGDFTSGTLDQTWRDEASNANRAVGQVNVFDNASNNFYLTGVQLELGSSATPFEHRTFGDELARCQRYFQLLQGQGQNVQIGTAYWWNNAELGAVIELAVPLRGTTTMTTPSGTNYYRWQAGSAYYSNDITGVSTGPTRSGNGDNTQIKTLFPYKVSVSGTWGQAGSFYVQGSSFSAGEYMAVSSEL